MLKYLRCIITYQSTFCVRSSPLRCHLFPAQKYEGEHGSDIPFNVKSVIENLPFSFPEQHFFPNLYDGLVKDLIKNNVKKISSFGNLLPNI